MESEQAAADPDSTFAQDRQNRTAQPHVSPIHNMLVQLAARWCKKLTAGNLESFMEKEILQQKKHACGTAPRPEQALGAIQLEVV